MYPQAFRSQSKHLHGSLPKVAELFIKALSERDVAKNHDNDLFVFDLFENGTAGGMAGERLTHTVRISYFSKR